MISESSSSCCWSFSVSLIWQRQLNCSENEVENSVVAGATSWWDEGRRDGAGAWDARFTGGRQLVDAQWTYHFHTHWYFFSSRQFRSTVSKTEEIDLLLASSSRQAPPHYNLACSMERDWSRRELARGGRAFSSGLSAVEQLWAEERVADRSRALLFFLVFFFIF